jgi:ATP-binding cassette subfamily A (ABC1) protein 3
MSGGVARCIGTPQHLKSRWGDGYTLEVRLQQQQQQQQQQTQPVGSSGAGGGGAPDLVQATAHAEQQLMALLPSSCTVLEREPGRLLLRLPIAGSATQAPAASDQRQQRRGPRAPARAASLADVFECVEGARASLGIADYNLAQSSLERVFLALAKGASHTAEV